MATERARQRPVEALENLQTPDLAAVAEELNAALGAPGAGALGFLVGQLVQKVGAHEADDMFCRLIAAVVVAGR